MNVIDPDGMAGRKIKDIRGNEHEIEEDNFNNVYTASDEEDDEDKKKADPIQSIKNWISSFFQSSISMGGATAEEVEDKNREHQTKEATFSTFANAVKNADDAQDLVFSIVPGASSLKKTAKGEYQEAVEAGILDALTFGKLKIFTSSKSIDKFAQVYTIYDSEGKLFKFGVTDTKLKRLKQSLLLAGPNSVPKLTPIMTKQEAHIVEKYFRTLHYNSTGQRTLPGMTVPNPINFNTGKKIK